MEHKFAEPLIVDLGEGLATPALRSLEEVETWISQERDKWNWISKVSLPAGPFYANCKANAFKPLATTLNFIQKIKARISQDPAQASGVDGTRETIRAHLAPFSGGQCLYSGSSKGRFVLKLADTDPQTALTTLGLLIGFDPGVPQSGEFSLQSLFKAVRAIIQFELGPDQITPTQLSLEEMRLQYASEFKSQAREAGEATKKAKELQESLETSISTYISTIEKEREIAASALNTQLDEHEKRVKDLEDEYETRLSLSTPTKFWRLKAKSHFTGMWMWGASFVAIVIAIILFLEIYGAALIKEVIKGSDIDLTPAVLITLPLFFSVWLLRLASRMYTVNAGLHWDARERVAMVETFLSLRGDAGDGVKDEERLEVIRSLFRPATVTSVDEAPISVADLIKRFGK